MGSNLKYTERHNPPNSKSLLQNIIAIIEVKVGGVKLIIIYRSNLNFWT